MYTWYKRSLFGEQLHDCVELLITLKISSRFVNVVILQSKILRNICSFESFHWWLCNFWSPNQNNTHQRQFWGVFLQLYFWVWNAANFAKLKNWACVSLCCLSGNSFMYIQPTFVSIILLLSPATQWRAALVRDLQDGHQQFSSFLWSFFSFSKTMQQIWYLSSIWKCISCYVLTHS